MAPSLTWSGSLHLTFRLLPLAQVSRNLRPFLESDGRTIDDLLGRLPYDRARSRRSGGTGVLPDRRRYRDGKQVYETAGLLYQDDDQLVHVTELGRATLRWLDIINPRNSVILARHAAYALSACQLRNPTGAGKKYDSSMVVFPFRFIWQAMLALDGKICSDELNRGLFHVADEEHLLEMIERIRAARASGDASCLCDEAVTGKGKNDRIIPWMSLASFGWTLFPDKRKGDESGYYELSPRMTSVLREAVRIRRKHRNFNSTREYVEYISSCAALPRDLR